MILINLISFNYYVEEKLILNSIMAIFGSVLLLLPSLTFKFKVNTYQMEDFKVFFIGLNLVILSLISSLTVVKAYNSTDDYHETSIRIVNSPVWVRDYSTGGFITDDNYVKNRLWSISGVSSSSSYLDLYNNEVHKNILNAEMNISLVWDKKTVMYEYDDTNLHNFRYVETEIIYRANPIYMNLYNVNSIIISDFTDTDKAIIPFLESERYNIYSVDDLVIFHYQNTEG